ncbi:MAG: hypothetical protein DRQ55_07555 [Planctomycetota bacterium]|nr:MAG: hypothetical protein DRQ55_07555 [Planctomycetota bacterium]
MRVHEWRDRTEDGELRLVRAAIHAGRWSLSTKLKSEQHFTLLDPPPLDLLIDLRDVLEGKYRRGRVPHEQLGQLDAIIANGGVPPR